MLKRWNRYGSETDVFDKYREAVRKSNRESIRVFGMAGIACAVLVLICGFAAQQAAAGIICCAVLLAAGIFGTFAACRPSRSRKILLLSGYLLAAAFCAAAVCGSVVLKTDAVWTGIQIAAGCFLLDYAWRVGLMQIASGIALGASWIAGGTEVSPERALACLFFLAAGLVTSYTVNKTRVSLITGREESQRQAETDPMTGLMNQEAAKEEIRTHLHESRGTGVLMLLDLDRFRNVNDRLGTRMGDKVLADVAEDLKKMFRNTDVLGRLGGDEFILYMKDVPEKGWAVERSEQVVRTVRRWVGDGATNIQVTASVGMVITDGAERDFEDLYRAADIAIYFSKSRGGNNAVLYSRDLLNETRTGMPAAREDRPEPDGRNEELK